MIANGTGEKSVVRLNEPALPVRAKVKTPEFTVTDVPAPEEAIALNCPEVGVVALTYVARVLFVPKSWLKITAP